MSKTRAVSLALAAALLLMAPAAFAAQAVPTEHSGKAEVKAFGGVKISLTDAIAAAETHSGGKALDVAFENRNGKPAYRVKTYQNNAVWEGKVDANSGRIIGRGKTIPESKLDREDRAELSGLQQAKTTLAQATSAAEAHAGGKAIDAGLEETNGKIVYEMAIIKSGALQKVTVDPANGQIAQP
jgi:uncharacterized membrane protein YkoI